MNYRAEFDVAMQMRDGCRLYSDIYLPEGAGPFPVLLQRLPYDKSQVRYQSSALNVFTALRRGYAIVSQDVRGRFKSEGEFRPFINEGLDGYDTCDWIVRQAWCNGSIGMFGASYLGDVQWLAAAQSPPGLKAIAPQMTPGGAYFGWFYEGGAFQLGLNLLWATRLAIGNAKRLLIANPSDTDVFDAAISNIDSIHERYQEMPLRDVGLQHELVPVYREWLEHPTHDGFWKKVEAIKDLAKISIPVFSLGGFYDVFLESTLRNHTQAIANSSAHVRSSSRLVIGPWAHGALSGEYPERSYGLRAGFDGADLTAIQLDWFDNVLSDAPSQPSSTDAAAAFAQGVNEWISFPEWPPSNTEMSTYYLDSDGSANTRGGDGCLTSSSPDSESSDVFSYDPKYPVPTLGGRTFLPGLFIGSNSGQRDQAGIEDREYVLCYTSDRLCSRVLLAGCVQATLYVSADVQDTDLTVKLVDVDLDDIPWNVGDGILRLRYRSSFEFPEMMKPGEVYAVQIDVGTLLYAFLPGHRLRVEISASNFPRFDRNTNTGGVIAAESLMDSNAARIVLHHSPDRPSHINLPVLADSDQLSRSPSLGKLLDPT